MPRQILRYLSRVDLLRVPPQGLIWGTQLAIFVASGIAAFLLRFDGAVPAFMWKELGYALPLWVVAKAIVFRAYNLDRALWRHSSVPDVTRSAMGNVTGSAIGAALILAIAPAGFPRSAYLLDLLLATYATLTLRLLFRMIGDAAVEDQADAKGPRALIYGAGAAGAMLLRELRSNRAPSFDIRGFIDDDRRKVGMRVQGVPVLADGDHLAKIVARHSIEEILVAIPCASGDEMARIVELSRAAGARCKTVPSLTEMLRGSEPPSRIREVAVEDLLGRSAVQLDVDEIRASLEGAVVVITGAGGSIGSELCRQVAMFNPSAIVGFDAGETPLFHIQQEMLKSFPEIPFHAEIGSVQSRQRLTEVFAKYGPNVVYHAAAYKHVPMMEAHIFEAVQNNVLGTYNVAAVAAEYGVETFVLISTDKAVRPANIMGLTKRVAEHLVQSLQQRSGTKYVAVRFGNVLGSQGSVVPIFKQQIAAGGPVTVTHAEMTRYFMTIPEAVQLVLQASTMGKGGEVFVLDMGKPVKIVDLARNLIRMSGLRPDIDIEIKFTGLRPGEKMYEELSTAEEHVLPTHHEKIQVFAGGAAPGRLAFRLNTLRELCEARDRRRLITELKDLVPEYTPSGDTHVALLEPHTDRQSAAA